MKFRSVAIAALVSVLISQQSIAAAPSSNVDPARDRIGQIVYPLGVHPPKDSGGNRGIAAKDKTVKKHVKPAAPATKDEDQ
jgi:hypothetical protein